MPTFEAGLFLGFGASLLAAGGAAYYLNRRLLSAERRAQRAERLAELGTLTSGLAHEIKNPLSTVQLNLQLLGEDLDPAAPNFPRLNNRLKTVTRETGRLRDILDSFLRFAGKLELEPQPTDLNQLLEELVDFFAPQAMQQKVQVRFQGAGPVVVSADPRLIRQVVLNLMLNAVQAMPKGGDLLLSARLDGAFGVVHVIDTGTGMTPDVAAKVFDAYYSTKRGGTGLGLAMAKRIIAEHGGTLSVASEPGRGSDFALRLPAK
jgi:signal transduction histidine kinase